MSRRFQRIGTYVPSASFFLHPASPNQFIAVEVVLARRTSGPPQKERQVPANLGRGQKDLTENIFVDIASATWRKGGWSVSISLFYEQSWIQSGLMKKEWKDGIRTAVVGLGSGIALLIITAMFKGEELKGLSKVGAVLHLLKAGVPLWLFFIVLVVAILGSVRWYKSRQNQLLFVEWKTEASLWTIAHSGNERWMQVMLHGFITNADPEQALIITSVYLEGTKAAIGLFQTITLPPQHVCDESVNAWVTPMLLEEGKTFRGNVIFVDQFQRKHKVPIELKGHAAQQQAQPTKT